MRIVDVCAFYSPVGGGVRTYIEAKLRAAPALGQEVVVLAPGERDEVTEVRPGAVLATIPAPTLPLDRRYRYFDDWRRLHRELDRWRPDHLEASSPWSSASIVGRWQGTASRALVLHCDPLSAYGYRWLGGILGRPVIDRLFGRFWRHLRALNDMFDVVVAPSRQYADRLEAGGVAKAKAITLGVEAGRFHPRLRDERLRADLLAGLGLPPSGVLLVGVGRFAAEKRWEMVIRAVAEAARSESVGLLLAGSGPRWARLDIASARHPNIGLLGQVGDRSDVARLLASADALVHGCEAETFGLAVSEARASGIPLIVPNRGGAREQLARGAGLAYRSGNERSLTQAIRRFVATDPAQQRRIAVQCSDVRTMHEHFAELFACYASLAAQRVRVPAADSKPVRAPAPAAL